MDPNGLTKCSINIRILSADDATLPMAKSKAAKIGDILVTLLIKIFH